MSYEERCPGIGELKCWAVTAGGRYSFFPVRRLLQRERADEESANTSTLQMIPIQLPTFKHFESS